MSTAIKRAPRGWLGVAALALASGAAGWFLGQRGTEGGELTSAKEVAVRPVNMPGMPKTRTSGALPGSFGDRVWSVRVAADEETTFEEVASCEPADAGAGVLDLAGLERALTEGTETERYAALTEALQSEADVPPRLLQQTYVTDLSDDVRLLAFTAYVDAISDDRAEVRNTLESGVYDMSAAVQAESRRRLAELERFELMVAEAPPQD